MLDNYGVLKPQKKFAIFLNNGNTITINAASFSWDEDGTLCIYNDENCSDDSMIAIFKQDVLYGISECCFSINDKGENK